MADNPEIRILFVEDEDRELVGALQSSLSSAKPGVRFLVKWVETFDMALLEIEQLRPHVVVLDLFLGDNPKGLDILKEIRSQWPNLPAILVTRHPHKRIEVALLEYPPDDFVVKYGGAKSEYRVHESVILQTANDICESVLRLLKQRQEEASGISASILGKKDDLADAVSKWGRFQRITGFVYSCGGRSYTVEDLANEIRKESPLGREFVEAARECTIEQLLGGGKRSDLIDENMAECEKRLEQLKPALRQTLTKASGAFDSLHTPQCRVESSA